jgi:hypothetical protein
MRLKMSQFNFKSASLFIVVMGVFVASEAFSQNADITGKPDDGLKSKTDMTLLKDGSEKAHVKEKTPKKSKDQKPSAKASPSKDPTDSPPATKGLPTDVD